MQTKIIFHIWLYNIRILIFLMRISRLMPNTSRKSKFSYTIKPRCCFLNLKNILLLLNRFRMSNYFIIPENVWVKTLFFLNRLLRLNFELKLRLLLKLSNLRLSSLVILRDIHVDSTVGVFYEFLGFLQKRTTFL